MMAVVTILLLTRSTSASTPLIMFYYRPQESVAVYLEVTMSEIYLALYRAREVSP